jgi:nucleoside-diphosphate-sugar epimerase
VTPTFIYKALKGESLPVQGGGEVSRDFIFVEDIVRGLMLCAVRGVPGDVYNIASGIETPILTLANRVNELTGNTAPVHLLPPRNWDHSGKRFGSTVKSRRELGFEAKTELAAGLEKTVEWTRQNLALIDACIARHADRLQSYGDSH